MKKFFAIFLWILWGTPLLSFAGSLKDQMIPDQKNIWVNDTWTDTLLQVLTYGKDVIFYLLWIIAIGVFLYFWFRLITSRGNEEDFKKALMWFVYAVIWLSIIPLAWWAVKLIATLKF